MADDAPTDDARETAAPAAEAAPEPAAETAPAPAAEPAAEPAPAPDPGTCKAIAIGLPAFWDAVLDGEFDDGELQYYLEPAGVLNGPLVCTRAPEDNPQPAGLLMTRAGWKAKKVFLNDGVNPETYELSFPKEFGYVKTVSHYLPATRENAKFPWSKKY